jgi:hypothetical protein
MVTDHQAVLTKVYQFKIYSRVIMSYAFVNNVTKNKK